MTDHETPHSTRGKWVSHRKRATRLAGMTASIVGKYASNKIRSSFQKSHRTEESKSALYREIGKQVVSTLGELKGAAMKVGQMLSQMQHLFPTEFTEELAALQNQAPSMDYSVIERQIILELGDYPENLFAEFYKTPLASASIGQVHKAVTHDGQHVVMKIQYPGVEQACKSDLKHLRRLLKFGGLLKVDPSALEAVFEELSDTLIRELDYLEEANQLKRFGAFHQSDENIIIPTVIDQFSTKCILTTSIEQGLSIKEVPKQLPQATINQLGDNLFRFIARQVFEFDGFHSDPHPGNFAYTEDGKLIVYDFGSVTPVTPEQKRAFVNCLRSAFTHDYQGLNQALIELKVRANSGREIPDSFYKLWTDIFLIPFQQEDTFDYGRSNVHKQVMKEWKTVLPYWNDFQPSADTVFINRVIGGIYLMLVEMGCQCQFRPALDAFLKQAELQEDEVC
jgi:predicted unusual protein kinase regulating ubiquinone biosynthesis (AarF/ABC1/UbiB family)